MTTPASYPCLLRPLYPYPPYLPTHQASEVGSDHTPGEIA